MALWVTSGLTSLAMAPSVVHAQARVTYEIPAQSLTDALPLFGQQSGLQVSVSSALIQGLRTRGVRGQKAPAEALNELLDGTGLIYRIHDTTVTLEKSPAANGAIQLGTVRVEGANSSAGQGAARPGPGWDGQAGSIYSTAGSVSTISRETIERYRGTSPADILKSESGVLSGEARNNGGLDVNIRGLQGQGRVLVTVDGTVNGTAAYRGYQGVGNRSFIDPDFIGGVSIEKGPSTGATGGIGGTVAMRTLNPDDIIPAGQSFAIRLKGTLGGNTTPVSSEYKGSLLNDANAIERDVDRPDVLQPTSGSASIVFASKSPFFDLVAGFSRRRSGNYHAGTEGKGLPREGSAPSFCVDAPDYCDSMLRWYQGPGLTRFIGGEEVLNTSQDVKSGLIKGIFHLAPDQSLEVAYSDYISHFGENYPSAVYNNQLTVSQGSLAYSRLKRYSAAYHWNPGDLVDLKANVWATDLDDASIALGNIPGQLKWAEARGVDIANTSYIPTGAGDVVAEYGLSYLYEATGPDDESWNGIPARQGTRKETSAFARASWTPISVLKLDGGVRYQTYTSDDQLPGQGLDRKDNATGFSLGATWTPVTDLQLFATYKDASRLPSLLEATRGFLLAGDPLLKPEHAKDWELGINYQAQNLFAEGGALGVKLVYFDNDISDYISRMYMTTTYSMYIFNIDKAKFKGLELTSRYDLGSFNAQLSATYYTDVLFCRTRATCANSSLAADYATNHIPPKFAASLTLSKSFMQDALALSGRVNHVGKRAAKWEKTASGASPFIQPMDWKPYTTLDLFASYQLTPDVSLEASLENVTDAYYVEPLNLGLVPAPGRTFRIGLTALLSPYAGEGGKSLPFWSRDKSEKGYDWGGAYVGLTAGHSSGSGRNINLAFGSGPDVYESRDYTLGDYNGDPVGIQAGYNYQLGDHFLVGVEADYDQSNAAIYAYNYRGWNDSASSWMTVDLKNQMSLRVRAGVIRGRWLAYTAAGITQASLDRTWHRETLNFSDSGKANGWTLGTGVEYAIGRHVSVKAEYSYSDLKSALLASETSYDYGNDFIVDYTYRSRTHLKVDQVKLGVNYRF